MESTSPPLTPLRQYISPIETSPTYREQLRRRTSSFSSNHDRSPTTPMSRHRFSNGSQFSTESTLHMEHDGSGGGGLGNLADELDQLDEDDDDMYDDATAGEGAHEGLDKEARDSGIDVSYHISTKGTAGHTRNFSKPFGSRDERPPDEQEAGERFSPELEDLMNTIARMTTYASSTEDPLVPRTIALLQDLGNQTSLEAATQRLTTSTNSLTAHLTAQGKSLQTFSQGLYHPVFAFSAPLDPAMVEQAQPLVEHVAQTLPQPDPLPLQKLQRLDRETADVVATLAQLADTLQMGKQMAATAARHLRTTQTMLVELRLEQDRADLARHELARGDWEGKLRRRWCGSQCRDIVSGFEERCDALRASLAESLDAVAGA